MARATQASTSQTVSNHPGPGRLAEIQAAARAVAPIHKPPMPGTAVNDPACSMVRRMYRRLSIAYACISTGRGAGVPMGRIDAIENHSTPVSEVFQVLFEIKLIIAVAPALFA